MSIEKANVVLPKEQGGGIAVTNPQKALTFQEVNDMFRVQNELVDGTNANTSSILVETQRATLKEQELELSIDGISSGFVMDLPEIGFTPTTQTEPTVDGFYTPLVEGTYANILDTNGDPMTYLPSTTDDSFDVTFVKSGAFWYKKRVSLGIQKATPSDQLEDSIKYSNDGQLFDKITAELTATTIAENGGKFVNSGQLWAEQQDRIESLALKENLNITKSTPSYTFIRTGIEPYTATSAAYVNTVITLLVGDVIKIKLIGTANVKYNLVGRKIDDSYPTIASGLLANTDYEIVITEELNLFGIKENSLNTQTGTGVLNLEVYNATSKKIYEEKVRVNTANSKISTLEGQNTTTNARIDSVQGSGRTTETVYNNALTQTKNEFLLKNSATSIVNAVKFANFLKEIYIENYDYINSPLIYISSIRKNVSGVYRLVLKAKVEGVWVVKLFIDETSEKKYIKSDATQSDLQFHLVFNWNLLADGENYNIADADLETKGIILSNSITSLESSPLIQNKLTNPQETGLLTKNVILKQTPKLDDDLAKLKGQMDNETYINNVNNSFASLLRNYYEQRVNDAADSVLNVDYLSTLSKFHSLNGTYENTKFLYDANLGVDIVVDGVNSITPKVFNLINSKDATQSVAINQPNVVGSVDKLGKYSLKKDELQLKSLAHQDIVFDLSKSTTKFAVTSLIKNYGTPTTTNNVNEGAYVGGFQKSFITIHNAEGIRLRADTGAQQIISEGDLELKSFGKYTAITLLFDGSDNSFSTFMNGRFVKKTTRGIDNSFTLNRILEAYYYTAFNGELIYHRIHKGSISYDQIIKEQVFLKQQFKGIKTTTIGTIETTVENLEITQIPDLTQIPNITDGTAWSNLTTLAWCFYSNDTANGMWGGKLYNGYARDAIKSGLNAYGGYGYHIMTTADANVLIAQGGFALKKEGLNFWNTSNGTNTSGFSAVGSGVRLADGTFSNIKNVSEYWLADTDEVLRLNHSDNTATIVTVTKKYGASIRLIKDKVAINFSLPAIAEFGFEDATTLDFKSGETHYMEFSGIDSRYAANNNWDLLKDVDGIADAQIQVGSDLITDNYAEVIDNPFGTGRVLHFNVSDTQGNDEADEVMDRGRCQLVVQKTGGFNTIRSKQLVYLGYGFNSLKKYSEPINWMTLLEVWHTPSWLGLPYPFRVKLNLIKAKGSDKFYFNLLADKGDTTLLIDVVNYDFEVNFEEWLTFEFYIKDGGAGVGEVVFKCNDIEIFNLKTFTKDPNPLNTNNITNIHPLKLYTSKDVVDYVNSQGESLDVYFDNWRLYTN